MIMGLKGVYILWKKEIKDQFTSPLVYILGAIFSLLVGWPFYNRIVLSREWTSGNLLELVLQPTFNLMSFLFFFLVPLITMRCFSEERKQHTLDLLFLSHLGHIQIIFGKFLSIVCVCLFILGLTLIFPVILAVSGYSHWGLVLTSYLGLLLSVFCYVAVGMFTSGLTENQILSALLSFGILIGLMLIVLVANVTDNYFLGQMLSYVSIHFHLEAFLRGAVTSYSFIFYVSFIGFFIFLTEKSLNSRHW